MISSTCDFDRHIGMLPSSCYSCDFDRDICMLSSSCEFDRHILISSSCELDRHILISSSCEFMLPIWTPNEDFGSPNKPSGKALFNVSYPKSRTLDPEKWFENTFRTVCSDFQNLRLGAIEFGMRWGFILWVRPSRTDTSSRYHHLVSSAFYHHLDSSRDTSFRYFDGHIIMTSSSCEFGLLSSPSELDMCIIMLSSSC